MNAIKFALFICCNVLLSVAHAALPIKNTTSFESPNMIAFFQSYDDDNAWHFNTGNETIEKSGYTTLIDAFWINYPYCWTGSPVPICQQMGINNAPGPGLSNSLFQDFWQNYHGQAAPNAAGPIYNGYWTSFHASGPKLISQLRQQIDATGTKVSYR